MRKQPNRVHDSPDRTGTTNHPRATRWVLPMKWSGRTSDIDGRYRQCVDSWLRFSGHRARYLFRQWRNISESPRELLCQVLVGLEQRPIREFLQKPCPVPSLSRKRGAYPVVHGSRYYSNRLGRLGLFSEDQERIGTLPFMRRAEALY